MKISSAKEKTLGCVGNQYYFKLHNQKDVVKAVWHKLPVLISI
jgi:hypothetical protein